MVIPRSKLNFRSQIAIEIGLSDQEIAFTPNDDFDLTTEQDFAEIDVQLYVDEDDRSDPRDPRTAAESFLMTVEQSRILTKEGEQFLFKRLNFLRFRANALQATLQNKRKAKKTQTEIGIRDAEAGRIGRRSQARRD